MLREIEGYKTYDGNLFEDEDQALAHATDLLGAELDGLFLLAEVDITRNQQFKALMTLLGKRKELNSVITKIHNLLQFN